MSNKLNSITITGTLVNVDGIRQGQIKRGKSVGHNYISGEVIMKCMLDGVENLIPVTFFTTDVNEKGAHSKMYDSYVDLKNRLGQRLTWTKASIEERRYVGRDGNVKSSQRIRGRFYNPARSGDVDRANFALDNVYVVSPIAEKRRHASSDKEGEATGSIYAINLIVGQPNYKDTSADYFTLNLKPEEEEKIRKLKEAYKVGDTVNLQGSIRCLTETRIVKAKDDANVLFGEDKEFVNSYTYWYIEQATAPLPMSDDDAYQLDDLRRYKEARSAADVELKLRAQNEGRPAESQPADAPLTNKAIDLL